jgi:hypothetical protein
MIMPILRISLVQGESKRAHSEIQTEEVSGISNRTHFRNALNYVALAELYAARAVKELRKIRVNRKRLEPVEAPWGPVLNQKHDI